MWAPSPPGEPSARLERFFLRIACRRGLLAVASELSVTAASRSERRRRTMSGTAVPAGGARPARLARSLTPTEWRRAAGLAVVIIGLHVVGFGLLFGVVAPAHLQTGTG